MCIHYKFNNVNQLISWGLAGLFTHWPPIGNQFFNNPSMNIHITVIHHNYIHRYADTCGLWNNNILNVLTVEIYQSLLLPNPKSGWRSHLLA